LKHYDQISLAHSLCVEDTSLHIDR
jgi:hypothetical protein